MIQSLYLCLLVFEKQHHHVARQASNLLQLRHVLPSQASLPTYSYIACIARIYICRCSRDLHISAHTPRRQTSDPHHLFPQGHVGVISLGIGVPPHPIRVCGDSVTPISCRSHHSTPSSVGCQPTDRSGAPFVQIAVGRPKTARPHKWPHQPQFR